MMNIHAICVCGAGTMGSGIAQVAAQSGFKTIQFDVSEAMLEKSKAAIEKNLAFLVSKQKLSSEQANSVQQNIIYTTKKALCKADVIIEAIVEKPEIKISLFNELAAFNDKETIFATNTSSLSVTELASAIYNPARVVGMHFFNPAPLMKLVEIVRTPLTDETHIQKLFELAVKMGKTPVLCNDAPGFIVNRVARHYYLEAMKLVEKGLATPETIDAMMENNGFKMGPFKLMDLIGMDINYAVSNIVWEALGKPERLQPSIVQKAKVDAGELGRKTGKGFYDYTNQ